MKVFDLHCDTLSELRYAEKAGTPKSFAQNDLHIDLQKLKKGDYMLQCFAAFVNLGDKTPCRTRSGRYPPQRWAKCGRSGPLPSSWS